MPPAEVIRSPLFRTYRIAKRIIIGIVGGSVLLVGILMIVLPGPAFVVIPVGLGILSLEFEWARRWLRKIKNKARSVVAVRSRATGSADPGSARAQTSRAESRTTAPGRDTP